MSSYSCYLSSILTVLSIATTSVGAPIQDRSPQAGSPNGSKSSERLVGPDGNPINTADSTVMSDYDLVPGQSANSNLGLYLDFASTASPQPIRGDYGATDPGPREYRYDAINSDMLAALGTDAGDVANAAWPMGLSHNRLGMKGAGWARQQNVEVLPGASDMAGVDMRLSPHAYRELHWHKANEWAFVMNGSCRIQSTTANGQTTTDDLNAGDVWFFPAGSPHSIQAFDQGVEFLLVFDDGSFSEEGTSLASELFLRNPSSVLAKNFQTDVSAFTNIPTGQLYIFPGTPAPTNMAEQTVTGPAGAMPDSQAMTFHWSQQAAYEVPGGSVKILDQSTFPITDISAALVTIKPGAMREIHWHLTSDEWNYFLAGSARITVFQAPQSSRTFDYQAGSVGYIPVASAHYIENVGEDDVVVLEMLKTPFFTDISAAQWLGLTPPQIVKDTLNLPDDVISSLPKTKPYILPGNVNMTTTNFTTHA